MMKLKFKLFWEVLESQVIFSAFHLYIMSGLNEELKFVKNKIIGGIKNV